MKSSPTTSDILSYIGIWIFFWLCIVLGWVFYIWLKDFQRPVNTSELFNILEQVPLELSMILALILLNALMYAGEKSRLGRI